MSGRLISFVMFLALTGIPALAADFSTWTNAMAFRFTGYTPPGGVTTLTNFPALVILSTNLPGFRYTDFYGANADLRFTDSTMVNELNYQVEKWDTNGSSYVWVQVPQLTDSNTQIFAFWGRSGQSTPAYTTNGATWANGYVAVWHMSETNALDSTSHRYNCISHGNTNAPGLADGAQGFNSTNTYLTMTPVSATNAVTVEAWVKHTTLPGAIQRYVSLGAEAAVIRHAGNGQLHFYMVTDPATNYCHLTADNALVTGAWYHVAGTWDGATQRLYKNGSNLTSATPAGTMRSFNNGQLSLNVAEPMDGLLDEVRLSSVARSSNWLWASWLNMASNSAFVANSALMKAPRPVNVTYPGEGVTNDQFDVSQGAKVFSFSTTLTNYFPIVSDPRDILGATRSSPAIETGHTLFLDGSVGTTRSISFRTASHINLTNYQLRVTSDGPSSSNRTINSFRLYGSADNMTYTLIGANSIGVPYDTIPGVTSAGIMISGIVRTPAYQFFRLEVNHGFTDGPRVVELDGFGPPASFSGIVLDPIVFNSTLNAASTNTYLDEDPGYATNIQTSLLNASYTVNTDGKYALGAAGAPEANNLLFNDTGNVPDNGDLIFGNGGETIHWISWNTTQTLILAGINIGITYPDRPVRLIRFSVDGMPQVFKNSGTDVCNVGGINSASTNLLFAHPVRGSSFKLELTGGTNSDGNAYGPRLGEINALLNYESTSTLLIIQ